MEFFFSIIIPVYNTEQHLSRCLAAIACQKFDVQKVQVIVVNDNSPNATKCDEVLAPYKKQLHIDYIKLDENMGTHVARKKGVECAIGKYFLFVDSDDYLEKYALSALFQDIQKNGDADYIEFRFSEKYGKIKNYATFNKKLEAKKTLRTILSGIDKHTLWNKSFHTSSAKSIWQAMPQFYAYYMEDYYQSAIIEFYAKNKRMLKKSLYVYVRDIGITGEQKYKNEQLKKIMLSIGNVQKNLCNFFCEKNMLQEIPIVKKRIVELSMSIFVNVEDDVAFIDMYTDIMGDAELKDFVIFAMQAMHKRINWYKEREKMLFPLKVLIRPLVWLARFLKNK